MHTVARRVVAGVPNRGDLERDRDAAVDPDADRGISSVPRWPAAARRFPVWGQLLVGPEPVREKAASEWCVWDECHLMRRAPRNDLGEGLAGPQRELRLKRDERAGPVGALKEIDVALDENRAPRAHRRARLPTVLDLVHCESRTGDGTDACSRAEASVIMSRLTPHDRYISPNQSLRHPFRCLAAKSLLSAKSMPVAVPPTRRSRS